MTIFAQLTPIRCARYIRFSLPPDIAHVQRNTEVRKLNIAMLRCEYIGCLQVTVDYVITMQVIQTFQDLHNVSGNELLVKFPERFQNLTKRSVLGVPEAQLDLEGGDIIYKRTHSRIMFNVSASLSIPSYLTMLGCERLFTTSTSRISCLISFSESPAKLMRFTATI